MSSLERAVDLSNRLKAGLAADIWYDAHTYQDTEKSAQIEDVQDAMLEAARDLLDSQREVERLRQLLSSQGIAE